MFPDFLVNDDESLLIHHVLPHDCLDSCEHCLLSEHISLVFATLSFKNLSSIEMIDFCLSSFCLCGASIWEWHDSNSMRNRSMTETFCCRLEVVEKINRYLMGFLVIKLTIMCAGSMRYQDTPGREFYEIRSKTGPFQDKSCQADDTTLDYCSPGILVYHSPAQCRKLAMNPGELDARVETAGKETATTQNEVDAASSKMLIGAGDEETQDKLKQ
jgi:hypothetical protein